MLDRLATSVEPVYIVGDANVHFERPTLPPACRLIDDLATHGLVNCVTTATHDHDGALDIVVSRVDLPLPRVAVLDVSLSDHGMLRWTTPFTRPQPVYSTVTSRPWSQLNVDRFRAEISASALCSPDCWTDLGIDNMAQLYDMYCSVLLIDSSRLERPRTVDDRRTRGLTPTVASLNVPCGCSSATPGALIVLVTWMPQLQLLRRGTNGDANTAR